MKHQHLSTCIVMIYAKRFGLTAAFLLLLIAKNQLRAQVKLSASSSGSAYSQISAKGFGNENPDCKHTSFGPHVTVTNDGTLGKYVFVFHSHIDADDDRCTNDDRVRMEIKGGSGSGGVMQHTSGQTAYYRWKFKLDAGFKPSSRFTHIFQIKAYGGDDGAPLITITPRAGSPEKMQIIHSSGEGSGSLGTVTQVNLAPFKGTWVEAYVKYKSSEGSAGTVEITLKRMSDGATLLSYSKTGIDMWRSGAEYNRGKWGVYRGKDDVLRDEQVRFDDFCISESSASQCPATAGTLRTARSEQGQEIVDNNIASNETGLSSFPNPLQQQNTITFFLERPAHTNLAVLDITGKQVAVLVNGTLQAGNHKALFNANKLAAGVYTLKLVYNGKVVTRKLVKE
ncbi:T9SS type A sorting domain-containing protein [Niastella caeni]|uniref:T9SS type A sorting domain-containing protein n=1 Tax=Niastella caeni TaxID=2569763 RepID=A0A4S8HW48_9BACT|nr:T9SS type A sorting domain-containing protein [Niastella caeni]THU39665.1 T9SS type A sorting domain-containing protein [Niastella caeni]